MLCMFPGLACWVPPAHDRSQALSRFPPLTWEENSTNSEASFVNPASTTGCLEACTILQPLFNLPYPQGPCWKSADPRDERELLLISPWHFQNKSLYQYNHTFSMSGHILFKPERTQSHWVGSSICHLIKLTINVFRLSANINRAYFS